MRISSLIASGLCMGALLVSCASSAKMADASGASSNPGGDQLKTTLAESFTRGRNTNPLSDYIFCADPTAVEFEGRLYVYGTNDHQEYEHNGRGGKNTYAAIRSLVVFSTDDMVNWTYHGAIPVGSIAPWILASWAPSITSRVEEDGKTHFYLYFSNSGAGVGVITATNPLGPWEDPLGRSLVDGRSPGIGVIEAPFDPGVAIDAQGRGWLALGGGEKNRIGSNYSPGNARIVKLGEDMISLDSEFVEIEAPYHFEANELNVMGDTWVYTFNNNWHPRNEWHIEGVTPPSACSMAYMTTKTPLIADSWEYRGQYFRNPGEMGMDYSNNHTHLHKYKGEWYLLFHSLLMQRAMKEPGGYRSICVANAKVDEDIVRIMEVKASQNGIAPAMSMNPYIKQNASTVWKTAAISFESIEGINGPRPVGKRGSWIANRQVDFGSAPGSTRLEITTGGAGALVLRLDSAKGTDTCVIPLSGTDRTSVDLPANIEGVHDIYWIYDGADIGFIDWMFIRED